jgi:hypothetical protein
LRKAFPNSSERSRSIEISPPLWTEYPPDPSGFLQHQRSSGISDFDRFFGCSVEFGYAASEGAASDLVEFSNDTLAFRSSPLTRSWSPRFSPSATRRPKSAARRKGTLRAAVENEVQKLLPHGKAKLSAVAEALALSVRTLSRRLADEGTSYGEVVDLAAEPRASICQGAGHVPFPDRVAARLRRFDLLQSCFQALDGTVAFR